MSTTELLRFGALVLGGLLLLLWRMIRAEDGYGFLPISSDLALSIASATLGAFALACFVFAFMMLAAL